MTTDRFPITQVATTIDALLDVPGRAGMAAPLAPVLQEAARAFSGPCDRVFLYNPDAIAQWIYAGRRPLFAPLEARADLGLAMGSVCPPVTPVCFASMYSGLPPEEHGIRAYVKPVLTADTVFDDLPRAGRRCAIVSTQGDSISLIFLGRDVDYFIFPTVEQCNRKALELIGEDRHHLIVLYNGNYDHWMHRGGAGDPLGPSGPEGQHQHLLRRPRRHPPAVARPQRRPGLRPGPRLPPGVRLPGPARHRHPPRHAYPPLLAVFPRRRLTASGGVF